MPNQETSAQRRATDRAHIKPSRPFLLIPVARALTFAALALLLPAIPRSLTAETSPATPQAAAAESSWKNYSYPSDGFSASFPSEPKFSKQDIPTAGGTAELHSYAVQDGAANLIVAAVNCGACAEKSDADAVLQNAKTGALNNTKSTLIHESKITLGDKPGISFESETDAIHLTVRIYLSGKTLYQIVVAYPLTSPYAAANRFFDSFQIIPIVPANPSQKSAPDSASAPAK